MSNFQPPPDVELHLEHRPDVSSVARHAVQSLLPPHVDHWFEVDALLATSELASNVYQHTNDGARLHAWWRDQYGLRVEVRDTSPVLPRLPPADPRAPTRRGLKIVNDIATLWGAHPLEHGKAVWFELHPPTD